MKWSLILLLSVWASFSALAQKKYVEEAISSQHKSGDYYVAEIPENKSYNEDEVYSYGKKNGFVIRNIRTRYSKEFGTVKSVVASFEFFSEKQKAIYDDIATMNSKDDCRMLLSKYSLEKQKIEKTYFDLQSNKISAVLTAYSDFIEIFPSGDYFNKINDILYSTISKATLPISFQDIKNFIEKHPELKNTTMEKAVYDYCLKNRSDRNYTSFIALFPNSTYTSQVKGMIENNFASLLNFANANPSVYSAPELERKALNVISSIDEAKKFAEQFPNSSNVKRQMLSSDYYIKGTYVGKIANSKREGKGYFFSDDQKYTYQGDWKNDMREGEGNEEQTSDYGYTYTGGFKNNKYNGYGKYNSTFSYEGLYYDGRFEGEGTLTDRDNLGSFTHTGLFNNGNEHGKGKRSYTDGGWFDGSWLNGNRDGEFEVRLKEGYRMYGTWRKNKPVGTHQIKKWTLGGLFTQYEGTAEFDGNGKSKVTENYNWVTEANRSGRAEASARRDAEKEQAKIKANQEREFRDFTDFKSTIKLDKYLGKTNPIADLTCPCENYKFRKENWLIDDSYIFISDRNNNWWLQGTFGDKGPFKTQDELLKYLYEKSYKKN